VLIRSTKIRKTQYYNTSVYLYCCIMRFCATWVIYNECELSTSVSATERNNSIIAALQGPIQHIIILNWYCVFGFRRVSLRNNLYPGSYYDTRIFLSNSRYTLLDDASTANGTMSILNKNCQQDYIFCMDILGRIYSTTITRTGRCYMQISHVPQRSIRC